MLLVKHAGRLVPRNETVLQDHGTYFEIRAIVSARNFRDFGPVLYVRSSAQVVHVQYVFDTVYVPVGRGVELIQSATSHTKKFNAPCCARTVSLSPRPLAILEPNQAPKWRFAKPPS